MEELIRDMKWMEKQLRLNPGDEATEMANITEKAVEELESRAEEDEPKLAIEDSDLKPIMRCPRCRQILVYNAKFCWECGQAIRWQ